MRVYLSYFKEILKYRNMNVIALKLLLYIYIYIYIYGEMAYHLVNKGLSELVFRTEFSCKQPRKLIIYFIQNNSFKFAR